MGMAAMHDSDGQRPRQAARIDPDAHVRVPVLHMLALRWPEDQGTRETLLIATGDDDNDVRLTASRLLNRLQAEGSPA